MSTTRASKRFLLGWFIVAVGLMGQAPQIYSQDPSCPHCRGKGPAPQPTLGQQLPGPALDVPGVGLPVQHPHEHGVAPIAIPGPAIAPVVGQVSAQPEFEECPIACVKLKIKAPACAEVGKEFDYRIKVENTSPTDAHNVIVKMTLPASIKVLEASPQVHAQKPDLQWNLGTIPGWGGHDLVVRIVPMGLADIKNCVRITYEHGQCVTTKVALMAPEGSADGRVPPGVIPGDGRPGVPGGWPGGPGAGPRADFDVRIYGPTEGIVGQETTYKVVLFNKGAEPVTTALTAISWNNEMTFIRPVGGDIARDPIRPNEFVWPKGVFEKLMPGELKQVELVFRGGEGRGCITVKASANSAQNKIVEAKDEICTVFRRAIPGMTLEMFDRDDPILKNGTTSYPIVVRNQGSAPIPNLRIKARVPDLLELTDVKATARHRREPTDGRGTWVEFEPLTLNVGDTQNYEIFVKGRGMAGETRLHVEMTADTLSPGEKDAQGRPVQRWIIEEESTTIVPDEEQRDRMRQISRPRRERQTPALITSVPK